jgi:hypothetical protein
MLPPRNGYAGNDRGGAFLRPLSAVLHRFVLGTLLAAKSFDELQSR